MTHRPRILEPQCEWTSADVADEASWTEVFDAAELAELDAALRHALAGSDDLLDLGRDEFPLPTLGDRLSRIEEELINGRGFVRLRGIPRDLYDDTEMEVLYWGIGAHLGRPWAQNRHGHVLGDVTDQGIAPDDPTSRGNTVGQIALPFHCDGSDLVGLLCLRNGREGGLSLVANSVLIHNRMVREHPDLAAALYEPLPYDYRGEQPPGSEPYYTLPVFTEWNDRLFVRCIPPYILASQRHPDAPRLTKRQQAALQLFVELADEPRHHLAMELRPGDIQFIDNYHVVHGRTAYTDDPSAGAVRHLKRLWLETDQLEARPPYFANRSHWDQHRSVSRLRPGWDSVPSGI